MVDHGEYDADVARCILGTLELAFQGMLDDIKVVEQVAHPSYKDKETFDFQLLLDKNLYTNLNSLHFVFTMRIRKATNAALQIEAKMITVNIFFAHWIKEIDITKYGTMKQLIPILSPQEIYHYSDSMLKHLPEKVLKKIRNFLFSEKAVVLTNNNDKRVHRVSNDNTQRTHDNLDDRIAKFATQIKDKFVYRIPLRYICDIGKINFPTKIDMKIRLTLETDMKKLFETKKSLVTRNAAVTTVGNPGVPDAQMVLLKVPYIQYKQLTLATNFDSTLKQFYLLQKFYVWEFKKTPIKKHMNYKLVCKILQLTFKALIDNLTG